MGGILALIIVGEMAYMYYLYGEMGGREDEGAEVVGVRGLGKGSWRVEGMEAQKEEEGEGEKEDETIER